MKLLNRCNLLQKKELQIKKWFLNLESVSFVFKRNQFYILSEIRFHFRMINCVFTFSLFSYSRVVFRYNFHLFFTAIIMQNQIKILHVKLCFLYDRRIIIYINKYKYLYLIILIIYLY